MLNNLKLQYWTSTGRGLNILVNLLYAQPFLLLFSVFVTSSLVSATPVNTTNSDNATGIITGQQLESFNACMQAQNANGTYNMTLHNTFDLSTDGNLIPSGSEPDKMLTEQELREERNKNPEIYKGDCFYLSDMTPQQLKRAYSGSGIG
jgi:hypothetical protein